MKSTLIGLGMTAVLVLVNGQVLAAPAVEPLATLSFAAASVILSDEYGPGNSSPDADMPNADMSPDSNNAGSNPNADMPNADMAPDSNNAGGNPDADMPNADIAPDSNNAGSNPDADMPNADQ